MFFNRKRNAKMQQELQDAAKDMRGVTTECLSAAVSNSVGPIMASPSAMPRKAAIRFVSIYKELNRFYITLMVIMLIGYLMIMCGLRFFFIKVFFEYIFLYLSYNL